MIKFFVYDIDHQRDIGCLHPFHIGIHDTHYIVDEHDHVIAYGDLETIRKRAKWLEDSPTPYYKESKKENK